MSDEVMEPLTDIMFKRKTTKKPSTDVKENADHKVSVSQQKTSSRTPKMKGLFGKTSKQKGDSQPKKKSTKPDPITNSIRNPSNQLDLPDTLPDKQTTPLGTSPIYEDSNDSDFLLHNPAFAGASEKPPRPQPTADPVKTPVTKLTLTEPSPESVTHSFPIIAPSSIFPPLENHTESRSLDSCTEYSPALLDNPYQWDQVTSPDYACQVDETRGISHSWEQCRDSPQFTETVSSSYDSHSALHRDQLDVLPVHPSHDTVELDVLPIHPSHDMADLDISNNPPVQEVTQPVEDLTNTPLYPSTDSKSHKRSESLGNIKDPSIISETEFQSFTSFFSTLDPQDGLLYGEQARIFFLRSELPNEELSRIWQLSDIDNDLKLTFREFCIAMKLVRNRKKGFPLPQSVPQSLFSSLDHLIDTQYLPHTDPEEYPYTSADQLDNETSSLEDYARTEVTSLPDEPATPAPSVYTLPQTEEACVVSEQDICLADSGELEETVTVESVERHEDIEDPIPKLSNTSAPTDYTYQIKSLFTPTPNPLPPPPSKTEMKQRSVLTPLAPTQEAIPRVEVTPVVQMRSHTTGTLASHHSEDISSFLEGDEENVMLSLHVRGGTDPKDLKKKKSRRRPDRVSAVILIDKSDHEDPQVSLINNGERKTIDLSPDCLQDQSPAFYEDLNHMQDFEVQKDKTSTEPALQSSPEVNTVKPSFHKKDSKMNILKKKLMSRNKKNTGSNLSLDKVGVSQAAAPRKKGKTKIMNKKGRKHKRSNSLDLKTNPRSYGSQNDIHIVSDDIRVPVSTLMQQHLFPQHKAVSTASLSPTHKQDGNDSDSFDSAGSIENLHSDSDLALRRRLHKMTNNRSRSLSSPEYILSTPPIPDPSSERVEYSYTPQTDLDDNRTPLHNPTADSYSVSEREFLTQRIHETFARCESLRNVNSQLISQLNEIRLQKEELEVQLRYHQPPRKFL